MPTVRNGLKDRLTRCRQIKISVSGRKSGKTISIPVWFVLEGENSTFCPCRVRTHRGAGTCSRTRRFGLRHESVQAELRAKPINKSDSVTSVIEKFRENYGAGDVKKYYSKFDAALEGALPK
jgi:hypothetical protein